ncbi:sensor histidine kinase [Patescibacteria group bacterium]
MIDPKTLSHITHEIRAPLTALRGYISLLGEGTFGEITDKSKEVVDKLHLDVIQTIYRINDFSALLKIEKTDKAELQKKESINLLPFVNEILGTYKLEEEQAVKVKYKVSGDESIQLEIAALSLKFIISFLLKHAARISEEGSQIEIQIDQNDNFYRVSVKDTAKKLEYEDPESLFEPFAKTGDTSELGSGLELFNCKTAATLIPNSKIGVLPDYNHGNTFYISLPFNN